MRRIYFYLLLIGFSGFLTAQVQFPKTPTKFMEKYKSVVLSVATDTQKIQLENFENIWEGENFSKFQKKSTITTVQQLSNKRQRATVLLQVGNILYHAKNRNASSAQIDTLVIILENITKDKDPLEIKTTLSVLENYLGKNVLFEGKQHSVYVKGDQFNLSFLEESSSDDYGLYDDYEYVEEEAVEETDPWAEDTDDADDWGGDWEDEDTYEEDTYEEEEAFVEPQESALDLLLMQNHVPTLGGALLNLSNVDLIIISSLDTVKIENTTGAVSLISGEFVGEGGKFDWTSTGLDQSVYATFDKYNFSIKKPEMNIADVRMNYPEKVDGEIRGVFKYKVEKRKASSLPTYPRFMSYNNDVVLKNLGDNIDYKGGFALNGADVFSNCVLGKLSTLIVREEGTVKFRSQAKYFELTDSTFSSNPSRVIIYFAEGDSITHPGVRMKYDNSSKKLSVRKDVTSFKEAPFLNSYHVLEMDVDEINWGLQDSVMTMVMRGAKNEVPAYYDSELMYSETKYIHLKSVFPFHPLQMIMNYCKINKTKDFAVFDVAKYYNQNEFVVKTSVASLQKKGLVKYNREDGTATLTDKAMHFYYSRLEKKDYDVISVRSLDPPGNNSIMDMTTFDLTVEGVDRVILSDSNDVMFYPTDRKIIFQKNRDILFDGKVTTNNYIFNGRDFRFNYETFHLDLANIDSIEFSIEVTDSVTGEKTKEKIDNKLTYSKGTLVIDETNNKSGLKSNPKYPSFDANHGASVLFNKPDILGGVYDTTFRYQIPPFAVDSLSGDMESTLSFDGEFYSGGVFPTIKQPLEAQEDRGFGFTHKVPEEGYSLYGGQAKFFGTITLGKNGLRGDGKIVFLNTTLESMDFVFFKDSVRGLGDVANTIAGGHPEADASVAFPQCNVTDYEMAWYPSKDSMHITNYDNAFKLYNNEVSLSGALVITTKGMKGTGLVETKGSLTISKNFLFKERTFSATEGQFEILSDVIGKPALRSDYVNVDIDLDKQQAWFSPTQEGYASNNFPYLKYKTSLNDGFWDMTKKIVSMTKPYDMEIEDSYFYSTKKNQDSLAFYAERAYYIIDSLKLLVEGVTHIKVADAIVYPDKNKVEIKENAKMSTLYNAVVMMDTVNEYHTLIHGEIDIKSKNDLDGHASYMFVNFQGDTIPIKFSEFKLEALKNLDGDIEYHTVSKGTILEEDTFMVAPKMIFKGEVSMFAHRRLLSMNGFIKLDLKGNVKADKWLRYENSEDVDVIRIDLESQENKSNLDLISGVHYSEANQDYYATFLGEKQNDEDETVFNSTGYLMHDLETKEFKIVNKERLDKQYYSGNLFGYIEERELYDVNGKFNLVTRTPEIPHRYTLDFGGTGKNNIVDNTFEISGLAKLNFEVPKQVYDLMGEKILSMLKYLPTSKTMRLGDSLYYSVGHVVGHKDALKFARATEKEYVPLAKTIKYFNEGIVLNDLNMVWNREHKSWHSVGAIGLVNVGSQNLNMFVKSYLEIKKTPEEDQVNLYIEVGPNDWYYFSYYDNSLHILSSDSELETFVESKNNEAKNLPRGLYYWTGSEEDELARFKKRFVDNYLKGVDIEIDYSAIPQEVYQTQEEFGDETQDVERNEFEDEFQDEFEEEFEEEFEGAGREASPENTTDNELEEVKDEFSTSDIEEQVEEFADGVESVDELVEEVKPTKEKKKKSKKKKGKKRDKVDEASEVEGFDDEFSEETEDEFEESEEDEFED